MLHYPASMPLNTPTEIKIKARVNHFGNTHSAQLIPQKVNQVEGFTSKKRIPNLKTFFMRTLMPKYRIKITNFGLKPQIHTTWVQTNWKWMVKLCHYILYPFLYCIVRHNCLHYRLFPSIIRISMSQFKIQKAKANLLNNTLI